MKRSSFAVTMEPERLPARAGLRDPAALLVLLMGALCGCVDYGHVAQRPGDQAFVPGADFDLHYIESDDDGWFWDPAHARRALAGIQEAAARQDTIVVLFTHGWHHSARCCDGNVEGFKEVLKRLRSELEKPMYASARGAAHRATGVPDRIRIVGLYMGWRGRSLPGLLDYATFWGRKSAAARVGRGDFQEFMARLQQAYDDHNNNRGPDTPGASKTFLGLVSIGHSFGGQALLSATAAFVEGELQAADRAPVFYRDGSPPAKRAPVARPLSGFGDLVVLVNPAVEAAAYQRVHALSMGLEYSPGQTPLMLTISADNDGPRHGLFRTGRIVGELATLAAHKDDARERELSRQALGVYQDQVTHRLAPYDDAMRLTKSQRPGNPEPYCGDAACTFDWYRWTGGAKPPRDTLVADAFTPEVALAVAGFDFSSPLCFGGVCLTRGTGAIPYQPLIVASAHPGVVDGHNGMFSEPLMDFLVRYIGFTEAKRYLQMAQRKGWM